VYLSEVLVSPEEHRTEISGYLHDRYGLSAEDYVVDGEERGHIPMTDYRFPRRPGERVYSVGMLGGETRPSTGYTFLRIQRSCRALAANLAGSGAAESVHPRRYDLLDGIFLRFVRDRPGDCPGVYARMFAGVSPDPLVRFLTEKSTPLDEARLIGALPKAPFLRLAGKGILERLGKDN
jgi:lycopene beta-cyclase